MLPSEIRDYISKTGVEDPLDVVGLLRRMALGEITVPKKRKYQRYIKKGEEPPPPLYDEIQMQPADRLIAAEIYLKYAVGTPQRISLEETITKDEPTIDASQLSLEELQALIKDE